MARACIPNDGRVVSNFIVQALKGEPITIYGDGKQTRAFCYVDDLIEGFVRLMAAPDDVTGPINLGNPVETTVGELAAKIIDADRLALEDRVPPAAGRRSGAALPRHLAARATSSGWEPQVALETGLKNTIAYFDRLLTENGDKPAAAAAKLIA